MGSLISSNNTLGASSDSSISNTITSTVTLGSGVYLSPLTITATGAIIPPATVRLPCLCPPRHCHVNIGLATGGSGRLSSARHAAPRTHVSCCHALKASDLIVR